jgi:hypothetical protein
VAAVKGDSWMARTAEGTTEVAIENTNATPGGLHPWEVSRGRCGAGVGTLGTRDSYQALEVGNDGTATSTAELNALPDRRDSYHVVIYASPTNRALPIACGNLAPPAN